MPEPQAAMRTFAVIEAAVRSATWPPAAPEGLPPASAASVVLRLDGEVIGRGLHAAARPDDHTHTVWRAASDAWAEARVRVPSLNDALAQERLRDAAARMTLSLELAGPLVPIDVSTWADASAQLSPGVDGVAARLGERIAAVFPSAMLASSMDPGQALSAAASRAGNDPTLGARQPAQLAQREGAVFYRFRTLHLGQTGPGEPAMFLTRGGREVPLSVATDPDELRRWGADMARHLARVRRDGGLMGTFDPIQGRAETPLASIGETAIAALGLVRWARAAGDESALTLAAGLLDDLAQRAHDPATPVPDRVSIAALAVALDEASGELGPRDEWVSATDRCRTLLDDAFTAERGFAPDVPGGARGIVAWALLRVGSDVGPAAVRRAMLDTPPEMLVGEMPWLGWAVLDAAEREPDRLPAVPMREMRRMIWEHQLRAEDLEPTSRDLAGAVVFTASRNPLPTWTSARAIAIAATMLGDQRLTQRDEVPDQLMPLLHGLRFLRQLTADEACATMYRSPTLALGGVRLAPWDQRVGVASGGLALLALAETLQSLDQIAARR